MEFVKGFIISAYIFNNMRCPNHKAVGGTLRRKTEKKPLDRVAEESKKKLFDIRQNALVVSKNKKYAYFFIVQ